MVKLTLKDISEGSPLDKFLIDVENDALAALATATKNMKYSGIKYYPGKIITQYKDDQKRLDIELDRFNGEWLKVMNLIRRKKPVKSLAPIIKSYLKYTTALFALEENNARHSAYIKANVAILVADVSKFGILVVNNAQKSISRLEKDLRDLIKLIKKAEKEVTEAKAQRLLNICISLVALCFTPTGLIGRVAVAGVGALAHMGLDYALGPSKASIDGTLNTATGEVFGVLPQLSSSMQNLASGVSDIVTFQMDGDEIAQAEMILKAIEQQFKTTKNTYITALKIIQNDKSKLAKLTKQCDMAISAARKNMAFSKSKTTSRNKIVKTFKAIDLAY